MTLRWKKISLLCLIPALLALCSIPSSWCATPELDAAEHALNEAKTHFAQVPYGKGSDLQKWRDTLLDEAAELAIEKEKRATPETGDGKRGIIASPKNVNEEALNQITYLRKYLEALLEKMQDPETVARYREIIAPVLASLNRLRDVLPALEKYDAELKAKRFPRTTKEWAKQIDQAEENLLNFADIRPTLMMIEHGVIPEMEAALMVVKGR